MENSARNRVPKDKESFVVIEYEELDIAGVYLFSFPLFTDERGFFREFFKKEYMESKVGRSLDVIQSNISTSKKGTARGIHYSLDKGSQWKIVTCAHGEISDFVVDTFPNSPTFGRTVRVDLNSNDNKALYIPGGLGHGFFAKEDSVVTYSIGSAYSPEFEKEINILDMKLNLIRAGDILHISKKDMDAISLDEALMARLLPDWE